MLKKYSLCAIFYHLFESELFVNFFVPEPLLLYYYGCLCRASYPPLQPVLDFSIIFVWHCARLSLHAEDRPAQDASKDGCLCRASYPPLQPVLDFSIIFVWHCARLSLHAEDRPAQDASKDG